MMRWLYCGKEKLENQLDYAVRNRLRICNLMDDLQIIQPFETDKKFRRLIIIVQRLFSFLPICRWH